MKMGSLYDTTEKIYKTAGSFQMRDSLTDIIHHFKMFCGSRYPYARMMCSIPGAQNKLWILSRCTYDQMKSKVEAWAQSLFILTTPVVNSIHVSVYLQSNTTNTTNSSSLGALTTTLGIQTAKSKKRTPQATFDIAWRYGSGNPCDSEQANGATNETFLSAIPVISKYAAEAFPEYGKPDFMKNVRHDAHTDEAWLAFYRVPQFGICTGYTNKTYQCGAIIQAIPGKRMIAKDKAARDINVAEISWVHAKEEGLGYGTQLMTHLVHTLGPQFDVLELKVNNDVPYSELMDIEFIDQYERPAMKKKKEASNKVADAYNKASRVTQDKKTKRLVKFYEKFGFETQDCHCDKCRLYPEVKRHIQMVYKQNKTPGTILLLSDVQWEVGPNKRSTDNNPWSQMFYREIRTYEDGVNAYRA